MRKPIAAKNVNRNETPNLNVTFLNKDNSLYKARISAPNSTNAKNVRF